MNKYLLFIISFFLVRESSGQIPMTSLLTIEQGTINVTSFEFWLEKDSVKFHYFMYDNFAEKRKDEHYINTNLYAFTDRNVKKGKYTLTIKLVTPDTLFFHRSTLLFDNETLGASVVSLIGRSKNGSTYLKDLRIVKHVKIDGDLIRLNPVKKLKIKESPIFEIICAKNETLFPYNHFGHFYGNIYQKFGENWETYSYVQPYQDFECELEHLTSKNSTIKCYTINKADCSKNKIVSKGLFKYTIDVGTEEMEYPIPDKLVESGILRVREFKYYTLEYEFKL